MFIIVGHDKQKQQVMIHDTTDHTTEPASYETVGKAVKNGYKINGLDARGNIICNEIDVFDELRWYLKPLLVKTLLLQLDKQKIEELIFPICSRYGVVERPFDLEVNTEVYTITFYLLGVIWLYKEEHKEQFHSIKPLKEFEQLPEETHYLLQELYKIPLKLKPSDLIIKEINQIYNHSYVIKFKEGTAIQVVIHYYDKDSSIFFDRLAEKIYATGLKHYIRRLAHEKPKGPYFIRHLVMREFYAQYDKALSVYTG